jgi:hypothetical protein
MEDKGILDQMVAKEKMWEDKQKMWEALEQLEAMLNQLTLRLLEKQFSTVDEAVKNGK